MLAATLLLVWANIFFAAFALNPDQQRLDQQEVAPVAAADVGEAGPSFEVDCAKCSFCCTPYTTCTYFDQTSSFTCVTNNDDAEAAAAYKKLVEEAKIYMITAPPGSHPTIAPPRSCQHPQTTAQERDFGRRREGRGTRGSWGAAVVVSALVVVGCWL